MKNFTYHLTQGTKRNSVFLLHYNGRMDDGNHHYMILMILTHYQFHWDPGKETITLNCNKYTFVCEMLSLNDHRSKLIAIIYLAFRISTHGAHWASGRFSITKRQIVSWLLFSLPDFKSILRQLHLFDIYK